MGAIRPGGGAAIDAETVVSDGIDGILGDQPEGTILAADGAGSWTDAGSVASAVRALLGITAGPVAGSGTFAARPATPALGDVYLVTSGARLGSIYRCLSAGTWTLDAIDWELVCGVRPMLAYDAEDLLGAVGGTVTRWRERQMGADLGVLGAPAGTIAGLDGASSWGSLACAEWGDAGTSPRLRATVPGPLSTGARTFAVVVSSLSGTGTQAIGGWGSAAATGAAFNIMGRVAASANTGTACYALDANGSGATPTSDTPEVLLMSYTGANIELAQAPITDGTPSWTTSVASTAAALVTGQRDADGPLTLGGYSAVGVAQPLKGRIHGAMVFGHALSSGERDALCNGLYARWQ